MEIVVTQDGPLHFDCEVAIERIECIQTDPPHVVKVLSAHWAVFECERSDSYDFTKAGRAHPDMLPFWYGGMSVSGLVEGDRLVLTYHLVPRSEPGLTPEEIETLH